MTFLTADSLIGFDNIVFNFNGLDTSLTTSVLLDDFNHSLSVNFTDVPPVPLPPSLALFGSGLLGFAGLRRWRRRRGQE